MAKVLLKYKDAVIKEIPLEKDIISIGRKVENDIQIDNLAVSGFHARIGREGARIFIEDLNSLNGTFVNGMKVSKYALNNGDVVLIGTHTLDFVISKEAKIEKNDFQIQGRSLDETVILEPQEQQKILVSTEKLEVVGGFVVVEGSTDKKDYLIKERITTIGKDDHAGIRIKGFFAPKVAALINRRKEGYFISPSGGRAVMVNGQEINQRYDLKDGDMVDIGGIKMQFYIKE
jgi:pSer/pThr/pTyr-binding forkhead associated (FHA) protein